MKNGGFDYIFVKVISLLIVITKILNVQGTYVQSLIGGFLYILTSEGIIVIY